MSFLTTSRQALWDAIDNWYGDDGSWENPLSSQFRRTMRYRLADEAFDQSEPSPSDIPCLSIFPLTSTPAGVTNESRRYPYLLGIDIYTAGWALQSGEDFWEKLVDAFFKSTSQNGHVPAAGTVSYVKAATANHPGAIGPVTMTKLTAGNNLKVLKTSFYITLNINFNPFA